MNTKDKECLCKSHQLYSDCCQKYHLGALPENALILMRSRYSAYALNLADYIIQTTHPLNLHYSLDMLKWKKEIQEFSLKTQFEDLIIKEFTETASEAWVTFHAKLKKNAQDISFTERSHFLLTGKKWLYFSGNYLIE